MQNKTPSHNKRQKRKKNLVKNINFAIWLKRVTDNFQCRIRPYSGFHTDHLTTSMRTSQLTSKLGPKPHGTSNLRRPRGPTKSQSNKQGKPKDKKERKTWLKISIANRLKMLKTISSAEYNHVQVSALIITLRPRGPTN